MLRHALPFRTVGTVNEVFFGTPLSVTRPARSANLMRVLAAAAGLRWVRPVYVLRGHRRCTCCSTKAVGCVEVRTPRCLWATPAAAGSFAHRVRTRRRGRCRMLLSAPAIGTLKCLADAARCDGLPGRGRCVRFCLHACVHHGSGNNGAFDGGYPACSRARIPGGRAAAVLLKQLPHESCCIYPTAFAPSKRLGGRTGAWPPAAARSLVFGYITQRARRSSFGRRGSDDAGRAGCCDSGNHDSLFTVGPAAPPYARYCAAVARRWSRVRSPGLLVMVSTPRGPAAQGWRISPPNRRVAVCWPRPTPAHCACVVPSDCRVRAAMCPTACRSGRRAAAWAPGRVRPGAGPATHLPYVAALPSLRVRCCAVRLVRRCRRGAFGRANSVNLLRWPARAAVPGRAGEFTLPRGLCVRSDHIHLQGNPS